MGSRLTAYFYQTGEMLTLSLTQLWSPLQSDTHLFPFFWLCLGCLVAYGDPGPGIRFKPQSWPIPQLHQCQRWIFNLLYCAGDHTCVPVHQQHHWSLCTTIGTPHRVLFYIRIVSVVFIFASYTTLKYLMVGSVLFPSLALVGFMRCNFNI